MLKLKWWQNAKFLRHKWLWAVCILLLGFLFSLRREYLAIRAETNNSWNSRFMADCAVVLTGGPGRVREGFDLLSLAQVKKLIISGVYPDTQLRDLSPLWSFYGNLNEEDIVLEKRSETTYGNAQQSLPIVEALRCKDVLLVTSVVHMHRSYRTFRAIFPETIPIQKHAIVSGRFPPTMTEVLFESLKSFFYSLWVYKS